MLEDKMEVKETIPVAYESDVVVVGGGLSGVCAAVVAARNGANTILIEEYGCCGGMATMGLVGPFMTCYDKTGEVQIIRGIFEELVQRLVAKDGAIHPSKVRQGTGFTSWIKIGHDHVTPFEPETLKVVLDEMIQEYGVKVLYHTKFSRPIMTGNRINGIIIDSKSGLQAIKAKVFIDCTGDADLAYRAGVKCEKGNETLGITQPASTFFRIGNVDYDRLDADIKANKDNFYRKNGVNYRSLHWRVSQARENGDWPLNRVSIGLFRGVKKDEWSINTTRVMGVDSTDNESLSAGEIEGRKQVQIVFNFLRKYVPGCENAKLLSVASTLGIRESRHIQGEYKLTVDDVLNGKIPEDAILLASNSVDIHGKFGPTSNEYLTVQNGNYYGIPYRCLVPVGVDGLLVAGRCVSASSEAAGAIRVMPPCIATGHAAGMAAAMAIKGNVEPRAVDTAELRSRLVKEGAYLG